MNDEELLATVRDCLTAARDRVAAEQLERPVLAIIRRARRRRLRQGLSTTVTAALVAVAAFALLPGSGGRSHRATSVRLAAWTVIDEPGGKIGVTIRELDDPAGLQRRLRADGVPVTIRYMPDSGGKRDADRSLHLCLYRPGGDRLFATMSRILPIRSLPRGQIAFTIKPSAIPAGLALWIAVETTTRNDPLGARYTAMVNLVHLHGPCPTFKAAGSSWGFGGYIGKPAHK